MSALVSDDGEVLTASAGKNFEQLQIERVAGVLDLALKLLVVLLFHLRFPTCFALESGYPGYCSFVHPFWTSQSDRDLNAILVGCTCGCDAQNTLTL